MFEEVPKFDIPSDFIVGTGITAKILSMYGKFPCRIKAGVFVYCKKGNIRATINLTEYTIRDNDFVTLTPETFIQAHDIEGEIELYFALFSSNFLFNNKSIRNNFEFLPVIMEHPVIRLPEEYAAVMEDYFRLLIRIELSEGVQMNERRINRVYSFFTEEVAELYHTHYHWKQAEANRTTQIHKEFMQLLLQHYRQEHSVSFYADKMGLTLQHFCSTIKKASGKTALEIISHVLVMDAKAQLQSTDLPIKEIALSLGFTNRGFFNKFFKQHVGMTPQEYRSS